MSHGLEEAPQRLMPPIRHVGCVRNFVISAVKWRRVIKNYGSLKNKKLLEKRMSVHMEVRESKQKLFRQIFHQIKSL